MPLVAGVDSSTQSTRVELRDLETGAVVGVGRADHPPTTPPRSEQDPEAWWEALASACSQTGDAVGEVVAVSVAGQQHGLVVLGHDQRPLRPAKLWNDTESAPHAARLVEAIGADTWARTVGSVPVAAFTITKLAWLVEHEPDLISQIAAIVLPHDYLNFRLTGEHSTDRGDASGTGWFDPSTGEYRQDLLALVGGRYDWSALLAPVVAPTVAAGQVTPEAAAATGLPVGALVGPGTGDNMAGALGLGLRPGDVAMSLGTSGVVYTVSETPTADSSGSVAGFCDAAGLYLPLVCTLNATKVSDAVAVWLGMSRDEFAAAAVAVPPGANGVRLRPYFDGERTPNLPDATGTFEGLRNSTTREDLARAVHEGVVNGLLFGIEALQAAGASANGRLHLIGGGARSAAYREITATLRGIPIRVPDADEIVATGACVQAAAILGHGFADTAERWNLGAGCDVMPGATRA